MTRAPCPGPFHDAVYDMFVRKGMNVFKIQERFHGRVSLTELRLALILVANHNAASRVT